MSYLLLAIVVVSWGLSWFAITFQVDEAPALVSIAYRFVLSSALLLGGLAALGRLRAIPLGDHPKLFALGFCLFSMNFFCFYQAALVLPSGLLSVVFATAAILGALNQRLFFGVPIDLRVLAAAVIGMSGLALLLGPQITGGGGQNILQGVALSLLGTYLFSLGNLLSARLSRDHALPNVIAQGMGYGAANALVLCVLTGRGFVLPQVTEYWVALLFLALISSVLAFLSYLSLVNREGPARAAYATVLFPIVAMLVSVVFEGYAWSLWSTLGLLLALGGTMLVFSRPTATKSG